MSEREIFIAALQRDDPAQRQAYLDGACAGQPDLRQQVEHLLRLYQGAGSFLEQPAMSPDTIFAQAIEIESALERAAFLQAACQGDPELRRELEQLVRDHFRAGAFLERPVAAPLATVEEQPVSECPGVLIGPHQLIES